MSSEKGKLILLHGLPGSGKSTFSEKYIQDHKNEDIVIVNRDTIRENLFGASYHDKAPDKKSESQVSQVQDKMLRDALRSGKTVIDDNTNLNTRFMKNTTNVAEEYGATIEQQYFNISVDECKKRNKERGKKGGRFVPEHVIDRMAQDAYDSDGNIKEFIISKNGVFAVSNNTPGQKIVKEFNDKMQERYPIQGKAVVLVDCDGTLANNQHHAEYYLSNPNNKKKDFPGFYKGIVDAPVNESVRDLANNMRDNDNVNIVLLTGRDDSYARELLQFVEKSGLKVSRVINKRRGDFRPDNEFKAEVINKLKDEGLIVVHALDDRESSIRTMESNGIMVSRVDRPDFTINAGDKTPPQPAPEPKINTIYGSGYCIRCGSKLKSGNIGKRCAEKANL